MSPEEADAKLEEFRAVIREGNAMIKDMGRATAELEAAIAKAKEYAKTVRESWEEEFRGEFNRGMTEYHESLSANQQRYEQHLGELIQLRLRQVERLLTMGSQLPPETFNKLGTSTDFTRGEVVAILKEQPPKMDRPRKRRR